MSTVGFLSLLGEDEIASMQRTLDTKKAENELPVYLRNSGAGSTLTASELFSAAVPTPREMDEFKRWLEEVLKATPRVIEREGKAPAAGAKLPPRLAVFLAFYRLGLPIRTIKAANIGAATAWTEQGRTAWPSAQWIEVPAIRAASGLNTTFSFAWWLSPKGGPLPSVGEMVRMPKVTVCHRFQTSVRESDPKAQAVRFRDDRKDLIDVFRGTTSESESVRAIKDQHSDWEADAVGAFMNKMKLEGAQVAEQEHGVSLLEGYLDTKRSLGWKRRWYVLTGGNGVTGMLSEYKSSEFCFKPTRVMYLNDTTVTEVTNIAGKTCKKFTFSINRKERTPLYFRAKTRSEMARWISTMLSYSNAPNLNLDLELFTTASLACNDSSKVVDVNTTFETLFGWKKADIIGKNIKVLMPADIGEAHKTYVKRYLKSRKSTIMGASRPVTGVRKDGTHIHITICIGEYSYKGQQRFFATFVEPALELQDNSDSSESLLKSGVDDSSTADDTWSDEEIDGSATSTSTSSSSSSQKPSRTRSKARIDGQA